MQNIKIGIIGIGNLGKSINKTFVGNGFHKSIYLSDNDKNNNYVINNSDILILSIKPSNMKRVLGQIERFGDQNKLIISSVAGIENDFIENYLNSDYYPIIRIMPNISIETGKGVIPYFINDHVNSTHIFQLNELFKPNFVIECDDEKLIDTTTLLNGSMPAILSYLSDIFIQLGIEKDIPEDLSKKLLLDSLLGTGELLKTKSTQEIIKEVCSPNGVTEQVLRSMSDLSIDKDIKNSISYGIDYIDTLKKKLD